MERTIAISCLAKQIAGTTVKSSTVAKGLEWECSEHNGRILSILRGKQLKS